MTEQETRRTVALVGAILWMILPVAWGISTVLERSRPFEGAPRTLFFLGAAALVGGGLVLGIVMVESIGPARASLREKAGLAVVGLGLVVTFIAAWATSLWAAAFGLGLLVATSAKTRELGFIGVAMLVSVGVFAGLTILEVGTPDRYGDFPAAWTVSLWVAALGAAGGLLTVWRRARLPQEAGRPVATS